MNNLREVKDDLLREWITYREETILAISTDEDNKPTTKKCPYCLSEIDINATRCPHCTSQLADETENSEKETIEE